MKLMTLYQRPLLAMACMGASISTHALTTNPPIQMAQGVEYMCGGKSGAEAAFMRMVSPRWAATLRFSVNSAKPGDVPDEVKVVVRERYTGRQVMEASTGAPYMLARLDPGAYEVRATLGGLTLEQHLVVFNGVPSTAAFVWPSNIDFAAVAEPAIAQRQAAASID